MKNLIKNQTIRIENHIWGSGEIVKWSKSIHLHKVMNSERYNRAEIIIPIGCFDEIEFKKITGKSSSVQKQLKNELEKAFKDKTKREKFAEDVLKRLISFSQKSTRQETLADLIEGAKNIAQHFELKNTILEAFHEKIGDVYKTYTSVHKDNNGNEYYIIQDITGENIRLGTDLSIIKNWDKDIKNRN